MSDYAYEDGEKERKKELYSMSRHMWNENEKLIRTLGSHVCGTRLTMKSVTLDEGSKSEKRKKRKRNLHLTVNVWNVKVNCELKIALACNGNQNSNLASFTVVFQLCFVDEWIAK